MSNPQLAFTDQGQGPLVVALHSSGMSSRQWKPLATVLEKDYRLVCPDLIGYGKNAHWDSTRPFHFHEDVRAVRDLLGQLGEGKVHLVGHSYGGLLAVTVARLDPERVASVTVYDPVAFGILFDSEEPEAVAELMSLADNPNFSLPENAGKEPWLQAFVDWWNGPGAWSHLPDAFRAGFLSVGSKVYAEVTSLAEDRTGRAGYAAITAPTLVCFGAKSPLAARRVAANLEQALPRCRTFGFEGAGHMGPITHSPLFCEQVVKHLQQVTS